MISFYRNINITISPSASTTGHFNTVILEILNIIKEQHSKIIHPFSCVDRISIVCVCFSIIMWGFLVMCESQCVIAENILEGVFCRHVLSCLSPAACWCVRYDLPKAVTSASSPHHTVILRVWLRPDHRGLVHQNLHRGREGDPIRQYVSAVNVLSLCVCVCVWTQREL